MPSATKHWNLCKEYYDSARLLQSAPHTRTFSLLAYYGAMHVFETLCASGVLGGKECHFDLHHDRVAAALRNRTLFGDKFADAMFSLYDFSYKARYIQQDSTTYDGPAGTPIEKRGPEINLDAAIPKSDANVVQITKRANSVLRKGLQLLTDKSFAFPCKVDLLPVLNGKTDSEDSASEKQ